MSSPESSIWSIDKILCSNWGEVGDVADVWCSNFQSDSVVFSLSIAPDIGVIVYDINSNFQSADWIFSIGEDGLPLGVFDEAVGILDTWSNELRKTRAWIQPQYWQVSRGLPVDEVRYAALAYVYQLRAGMNPTRITELLAEDMNCSASTAKERIRKSRVNGFLSSPGKGLGGQGKIQRKAIQLLKKEGMLK